MYKFELAKTINAGNYESVRIKLEAEGENYERLVNDVESKMVSLERKTRDAIAGRNVSPVISAVRETEKTELTQKSGPVKALIESKEKEEEEEKGGASDEPTLLEVRAAVGIALANGAREHVRALLSRYDAASVSMLNPKSYKKFLSEL